RLRFLVPLLRNRPGRQSLSPNLLLPCFATSDHQFLTATVDFLDLDQKGLHSRSVLGATPKRYLSTRFECLSSYTFLRYVCICHRVFEISAHFERRGRVERTTLERDFSYFKVHFE